MQVSDLSRAKHGIDGEYPQRCIAWLLFRFKNIYVVAFGRAPYETKKNSTPSPMVPAQGGR